MDELDVLAELAAAEARGIVVDDRHADDQYRFHDKLLAGVFRNENGGDAASVRQMAREYHARFVQARMNELASRHEDPERL